MTHLMHSFGQEKGFERALFLPKKNVTCLSLKFRFFAIDEVYGFSVATIASVGQPLEIKKRKGK
jgi:hypothetical protein